LSIGIDVSDIFAEVDEDLRADRAQQMLRKYGGALFAAALVVIAAVAGWQAWKAHQAREAARLGGIFLEALDGAAGPAGPAREKALAELAQVAREGGAGYRTLARMREASLRFDAGEKDAALGLWDQAAQDGSADPLLRDLASLMWVWHQIDTGPPAALRARLAPLAAPENAWRPLAEEAQALLDIREGHKDAARDTLRRLSQDSNAPDGVRGRAGGLLARLGG
jgi:hypothetical protein